MGKRPTADLGDVEGGGWTEGDQAVGSHSAEGASLSWTWRGGKVCTSGGGGRGPIRAKARSLEGWGCLTCQVMAFRTDAPIDQDIFGGRAGSTVLHLPRAQHGVWHTVGTP